MLALAIVLALVLVAAPTADAHHFADAKDYAADYFDTHPPRCGEPIIRIAPMEPELAQADPARCLMRLAERCRPWSARRKRPFLRRVVTHEYGHVLGYRNEIGYRWVDPLTGAVRIDHLHSPDPDAVMYPFIDVGPGDC